MKPDTPKSPTPSPKSAPTTATATVPRVRRHKTASQAEPLVMVTAYDYPTAKIADEAGADILLVGDSLAMVVLGLDDTLSVTVDDMAYHVRAVARAQPKALVVADMPWLSYHVSPAETVENAAQLIRAGASAVKLEGGQNRLEMVSALTNAEIPVMGHIGLTPQSINMLGGFKVQCQSEEAANMLVATAQALEKSGCFSLVLEGIPSGAAKRVTEALEIPTIGIGAGPDCDGQVLVFHDVLGLQDQLSPKFVRQYASLKQVAVEGLAQFAQDVRSRAFPSEGESYNR